MSLRRMSLPALSACLFLCAIALGSFSEYLSFDASYNFLAYRDLLEHGIFEHRYGPEHTPFDPTITTGPTVMLPIAAAYWLTKDIQITTTLVNIASWTLALLTKPSHVVGIIPAVLLLLYLMHRRRLSVSGSSAPKGGSIAIALLLVFGPTLIWNSLPRLALKGENLTRYSEARERQTNLMLHLGFRNEIDLARYLINRDPKHLRAIYANIRHKIDALVALRHGMLGVLRGTWPSSKHVMPDESRRASWHSWCPQVTPRATSFLASDGYRRPRFRQLREIISSTGRIRGS